MAHTPKVWHLLPHDPHATERLARAANVSPVIAQLLLNREITDPVLAKRFLACSLADLHPPPALPGIRDAADRIVRAVAEKRKICIYGDYDVDGVTGTAILTTILEHLGADVRYHTPNRVADGYGLHAGRLRELAQSGIAMVITVDCGIASVAEAEEAERLGLELIITDHHEMKVGLDGLLLPRAAAIVHPRLPGCNYPFGELSGAGVALKLAWAIGQRVSGADRVRPELRELLLDAVGLAALGLVADVVPLHDENRILVKHGLARIRSHPSIGLRALMRQAGIEDDAAVTAEDVGFKIAPRLNAAGRLGCAMMAIELLTTRTQHVATTAAAFLEGQNSQRQGLERKYVQEAREMIDRDFANAAALVVGSPEWKPGVVGIVASRLVDHYGKPALVISMPENNDPDAVATGSGRSIPGFELHAALRACDELLVGHGGHAAAAGFKVRPAVVPALRDAFNTLVARQFPGGTPEPRIVLDAEVPLSALTFALLRDIDKLEPYGAGNPKPKFLASGLKAEFPKAIGKADVKKHLAFRVRQGSTVFRCVGWNMVERVEELMSAGGDCSIAFTPRVNKWNDISRIDLQVVDFQAGKTAKLG